MATLTPEQISRATKLAGGNYIEPSTRAGLIANGKWNVPEIKSAINASIAAEKQAQAETEQERQAQVEQLRQVQAEQQKQAQVQARPSQSLESTAVNLGYSGGDYTDTNALQDFINKAQAQPQAQAATTSPSNQSVLALNNPTGLAVTGQPAAQAQARPNQSLESEAVNLGYSGDYTDTNAMQDFINKAQAQPQVQAATTSPSNQSVLTLNNPTGLAVTGQPTAQVQPTMTTLYKDGRTVSVDDANLNSYLADGWSTDIPPPTPNTQSLFNEGNTTLGKTLADANTTFGKTFTDADTTFGKTLADANTTFGKTFTDADTTFGKTLADADTTLGKTLAEGNTTVGNTLNDWGDEYSTKMDATLQNFGTQATNGFMGAFKNFAIPTSQQNGVNLGNYNDNRNAAADQWWSSYVTGRR
jgi:hypothetical protein